MTDGAPLAVAPWIDLGIAYGMAERYEEAEPIARRLVVFTRATEPVDPGRLATATRLLGIAFAGTGRYTEGVEHLIESWNALQDRQPRSSGTEVRVLTAIVRCFEALQDRDAVTEWQGRLDEARARD